MDLFIYHCTIKQETSGKSPSLLQFMYLIHYYNSVNFTMYFLLSLWHPLLYSRRDIYFSCNWKS